MAGRSKRRFVSQADYAKHRGCKPPHINRLVKAGVIPLTEGMIDVDEADAILVARSDPGKAYSKRKHPGYDPLLDEPVEDGQEPRRKGEAGKTEDLAKRLLCARIKREEEQGRLAELTRRKREGELIETAEVERVQFARAVSEREALLNWPKRIGAEMAAELGIGKRLLEDALTKYIRKHLEERSVAVVEAEA